MLDDLVMFPLTSAGARDTLQQTHLSNIEGFNFFFKNIRFINYLIIYLINLNISIEIEDSKCYSIIFIFKY